MKDEANILEDGLNKAFDSDLNNDVIDIDSGDGDTNEAETTSNNEEEETLESLMQEVQGKTKENDNKTDNNVSNIKQNSEQSANKPKGNNNSKDLVDKDGNIIAKAGAERRFYEENVKLKKEKEHFTNNILPTIRKNYEDMRVKVNSYEQAFSAMKADDLTPEEVSTGIQLMRNWKKSPEETMKFLLTQAKSYGINLDNTTSGVDMAAINQMLDQKLQPFIQEREEVQRNKEISQRSHQIYNNFMNKYPDAKNHTKEIAYLYRKNPDMSLDAIYYQLKNHYLENGYDFNTPLAEIINKQSTKPNKSVPFGSPNVNQTTNAQKIKQPIASINKSYDDIIKETMKMFKR